MCNGDSVGEGTADERLTTDANQRYLSSARVRQADTLQSGTGLDEAREGRLAAWQEQRARLRKRPALASCHHRPIELVSARSTLMDC